MGIAAYPTKVSRVEQDLLDYFGDGSDGDVSIVGTVTLTRDMQYRTLVVPASGVLVTNGWFVRASVSIVVEVGGIIHADGTAGGTGFDSYPSYYGYGGGGGQGGGVVALYTPSLANQGIIRANGGAGGSTVLVEATSGLRRTGGGTVDNGGGGGGAGGIGYLGASALIGGAAASGGIGRTNGGGSYGVFGSYIVSPGGTGGAPGGPGIIFSPIAGQPGVLDSTGGGGVGRAGPPVQPPVVSAYFAGGSGGHGGTWNYYYTVAKGGATWGPGGTLDVSTVDAPDVGTCQSFRACHVPHLFKGRPGPRPYLFGGGGGGGGMGYWVSPGGGGGGGLILTVTKTRFGAGSYVVSGGAAGTTASSGASGIAYVAVAGATGNAFHFKYRD